MSLKAVKTRYRILILALSSLVTFFFYKELVLHPSDYKLAAKGDGAKFYYSIEYHIKDSSSTYFHFNGMNYPFGENLHFLDALPGWTIPFKFVQNNIYPTGRSIFTFYHLFLLVSFPLAAFLIQEIFFKYGAVTLPGLFFALTITFISPQIHRLYTHLSLACLFIIPLAWYLYLWAKENNRKRLFPILILFLFIFSGFLHLYFVGILALLLLALILAENSTWTAKIKNITFQVIIPVLLVQLLMKLKSSNVDDRVDIPYGAFGQDYRSRPEDVFFPNPESLWNNYVNFEWLAHGSWEGEAFVGFGLWIAIMLFIIYLVKRKSVRNKKFKFFNSPTTLIYFALLLFILTAGTLHFVLPWEIKTILPSFIKQFRSLGRLSWLIYFLFSIYFYLFLIKWIKKQQFLKNKIALSLTLVPVFLFNVIDIIDNNTRARNAFINENSVHSLRDKSIQQLSSRINPGDFQAIITLPYFHIGSDLKISREPVDSLLSPAFDLSLLTHLPLTNMVATRSSISQTLAQLQVFQKDKPEICNSYSSRKPFLILTSENGKTTILNSNSESNNSYPNEKALLEKAVLFQKEGRFLLYTLAYDSLCTNL